MLADKLFVWAYEFTFLLSHREDVLRLKGDLAERVMKTAAQIEYREALNPEEDIFRQMNDRLADLLRLQIILEVMYEMASREIPVKEIAEELGFPEQFTFRKYFKTHTGMSPTDFRTKNIIRQIAAKSPRQQ